MPFIWRNVPIFRSARVSERTSGTRTHGVSLQWEGFRVRLTRHRRMSMYAAFFRGSQRTILLRSVAIIAIIALVDWQIVGEVPLGFLYLLPMLMVGSVLSLWQIAIAAIACTMLAEIFDDFAWNLRAGVSRDLLYFAAFFGAGVFV